MFKYNWKEILLFFIKNPVFLFIYISAKLNLPKLCSFLLLMCIKSNNKKKTKSNKENYLVLYKSIFIDDIKSTFKNCKKVNLIFLGRTCLHYMSRAFFDKNINDNNYHDLSNPNKINAYRSFLLKMWKSFNKNKNFKCVLSGNFGYFEERELAYILENSNIPFIVIHKECFKTKARLNEYEELYRSNKGPFWGSLIMVYNKVEKDLIIRTGITDKSKVKIVGMPRLDKLINQNKNFKIKTKFKKVITLISFHKDLNTSDSITSRTTNLKRIDLTKVWEYMHKLFYELATEYPDYLFCIKTKGNTKDLENLRYLSNKNSCSNFKIFHGGSLNEIILKSDLICGLHSTALLEAMAVKKPILIQSDPDTKKYSNNFIDFGKTVNYCISKEDLRQTIESFCLKGSLKIKPSASQEKKLIKNWLGNVDGNSGNRAMHEIKKVVMRYEKRNIDALVK